MHMYNKRTLKIILLQLPCIFHKNMDYKLKNTILFQINIVPQTLNFYFFFDHALHINSTATTTRISLKNNNETQRTVHIPSYCQRLQVLLLTGTWLRLLTMANGWQWRRHWRWWCCCGIAWQGATFYLSPCSARTNIAIAEMHWIWWYDDIPCHHSMLLGAKLAKLAVSCWTTVD